MNTQTGYVAARSPRLTHLRQTIPIVAMLSLCLSIAVSAQDTSNLSDIPGHRPVRLGPTTQPVSRTVQEEGRTLGGWTYRSVRSPNPREGVPWELIATPAGPIPEGWKRGRGLEGAGLGPTRSRQGDIPVAGGRAVLPFPVVELPDVLWKQWMSGDILEAVGVHFHEVVTDDVARILYSLHRIPPEEPDATELAGKPAHAKPTDEPPVRGTRIEATLLAPLAFHLEQSIAVRTDERHKDLAQSRAKHEIGHAELSQRIFFEVIAGPQDWKPEYCTGRRSRIEYFWRRDQIGRSWDGYRGGKGEIVTMRTSVVLVPPTRWSVMLPVPPERVTQKQLDDFNDALVRVSARFVEMDAAAQDEYHARHGGFEAAREP